MTELGKLTNSSRPRKGRKRLGRGQGSGLGKTSGRGHKGAGSRSGHKARYSYEGGQFRTFMRMPVRGFSHARFRKPMHTINLGQIDLLFSDGECVCEEMLRARGFISGTCHGVKLLGKGNTTRKVSFEIDAISKGAREKVMEADLTVTLRE